MKYAKGGLLTQPIEITGDAEPLIPQDKIDIQRLVDVLKLDCLLVLLETSLEFGGN